LFFKKEFSYPAKVWIAILEFLFSDKQSEEPQFGSNKRKKPAAVKKIAELIFSNRVISRSEFQAYPNLSHTFESNVPLAQKTTPSSSRFGIELKKYDLGKKEKHQHPHQVVQKDQEFRLIQEPQFQKLLVQG